MKKIHSIIDFQNHYMSYEMIATLQAICYHLVELLTPPEILQIRFITRKCVSKILLPTRDKDGYPISGQDVVP